MLDALKARALVDVVYYCLWKVTRLYFCFIQYQKTLLGPHWRNHAAMLHLYLTTSPEFFFLFFFFLSFFGEVGERSRDSLTRKKKCSEEPLGFVEQEVLKAKPLHSESAISASHVFFPLIMAKVLYKQYRGGVQRMCHADSTLPLWLTGCYIRDQKMPANGESHRLGIRGRGGGWIGEGREGAVNKPRDMLLQWAKF